MEDLKEYKVPHIDILKSDNPQIIKIALQINPTDSGKALQENPKLLDLQFRTNNPNFLNTLEVDKVKENKCNFQKPLS